MVAFKSLALHWMIFLEGIGVNAFPLPALVSTKITTASSTTFHQCRENVSLEEISKDERQRESWQHPMNCDLGRRDAVASIGWFLMFCSCEPSYAADGFNNPSPFVDLSQQIRKSAVRGAKLIDEIDGKWERFSDDFGLGEKRNMPKVDNLNVMVSGGSSSAGEGTQTNFDAKFASVLLQECDLVSVCVYVCVLFNFQLCSRVGIIQARLFDCLKAFLKTYKVLQSHSLLSAQDLSSRVTEIQKLVRKSFFSSKDVKPTPQEDFNYELFTHFKAYNDILVEKKVVFPPFFDEFERVIGKRILELAIPLQSSLSSLSSSKNVKDQLNNAFQTAESIGTLFVDSGFITSWERSVPSKDDVEDFIEPYLASAADNFYVPSDLKFTLSLNGDVSLNSQLLLQELGYRLYPSFGRWLLQQSLMLCFSSNGDRYDQRGDVRVNIDDYYMDTSYNSNPDLFEVKQILLNVVLERS
ncbi:hypothetical protein HJC23_013100 [Cyclotella cryptica]|uniref:Uncharacterized protein n=1 Tax=Cyclotella cryptica TaxID=29204 RepID=A0ABD3PGP2_9STRA